MANKTKRLPSELWAFYANSNGTSSNGPVRLKQSKIEPEPMYITSSFSDGVMRINPNDISSDGYLDGSDDSTFTFISPSKKEVEIFIRGFNAQRHLFKSFMSGASSDRLDDAEETFEAVYNVTFDDNNVAHTTKEDDTEHLSKEETLEQIAGLIRLSGYMG